MNERQSPTPKRLPIVILTGFLGSGKTTLLNRLLSEGPRSAVLINEFGPTPIDQKLIEDQNLPLMTLSGGCLCCQVRASLPPVLKNIRMGWEHPKAPQFDRLIIETSGVASPEPVIDCLHSDKWLSRHFRLEAIIAVIAAPTAETVIDRHLSAITQLSWADRIWISHVDKTSPRELADLKSRLSLINPTAGIFGEHETKTSLKSLLNSCRGPNSSINPPDTPAEHPYHSISLQLKRPIEWEILERVLVSLVTIHEEIVRIKGVIHLTDRFEPVAVHGVTGRIFPLVSLPITSLGDSLSRMIIITEGPPTRVDNLLRQLLDAAQSSTTIHIH